MADDSDLARELIGRARDDRAAAAALLGVGTVSDAVVGFHAQQAVEKALEAVLAAASADFPFTHNIALLMQLCDDAGIELPASLGDADLLTPYGVALRYGTPSPCTLERRAALELADAAVAWAERILGD
jgi:HEPN domain-containing protein